VPIGRQTQASELELQGRAISSADGLPPLLLLGREFTHEQAEGMGNRMQREEGRVGSSDWPKKPPARTCPARILTSSLCIPRPKQDISIIGQNFTSVILQATSCQIGRLEPFYWYSWFDDLDVPCVVSAAFTGHVFPPSYLTMRQGVTSAFSLTVVPTHVMRLTLPSFVSFGARGCRTNEGRVRPEFFQCLHIVCRTWR
jgi:hypothetical protein